jgi:enamine deaminase RidA (YjgF/YER057c/UK114 family)
VNGLDGKAAEDEKRRMRTVLPDGWPRPGGYANAIACTGEMIVLAGQIGWTPDRTFETDDFVGQVRQALLNVREVLAAAGARPEHLVRLTWYVTDMAGYRERLSEVGTVYREVLGKVFPAMSCVAVPALVEARAKVEIEATAVIAQGAGQ